MKIIDYSKSTAENKVTANSSLKENVTAALMFIIPALLLMALSR